MPRTPKPPKYADPATTADTQFQYNTQTGQSNQALNMVDQSNPFGSLTYGVTGTDPVTGLPTYGANNNYNSEQQALLDQLVGTKGSVGGAAGNLAQDVFAQYSSAPDLVGGASSLTQQGIDRELPGRERFYAPQRDQLDNNLRNQGILPGTPPYHQQMDAMLQQQNRDTGQWQNTYQDQAFKQATTEYALPAEMISKLMSLGAPADLKNNLINTPTTSIGNTDYAGQVKAQYDAKMAAYQAAVQRQNSMMSGIMGIGGSMLGGPIGGMIGSGIGSMAGNLGSSFIPPLT